MSKWTIVNRSKIWQAHTVCCLTSLFFREPPPSVSTSYQGEELKLIGNLSTFNGYLNKRLFRKILAQYDDIAPLVCRSLIYCQRTILACRPREKTLSIFFLYPALQVSDLLSFYFIVFFLSFNSQSILGVLFCAPHDLLINFNTHIKQLFNWLNSTTI